MANALVIKLIAKDSDIALDRLSSFENCGCTSSFLLPHKTGQF